MSQKNFCRNYIFRNKNLFSLSSLIFISFLLVNMCSPLAFANKNGISPEPEIASVNALPVVINHPSNKQVCYGSNVSFVVSANGSAIQYKWQVNSGNGLFYDLSDGGAYSGTQSNSLQIIGISLAYNNFQYRCVVSNSEGSVISDAAWLSVSKPEVSVSVTGFKASAEVSGGIMPYGFTWASNSATGETAEFDQAGNYSVSVSDAKGCVANQSFTIGCDVQVNTTKTSCDGNTDGTATVVVNGGMYSGSNSSGNSANCQISQASTYTCTTGCTPYSSNTGTITVNPGETVCVTATNFTGNIIIWGGTLIICGNVKTDDVQINNNENPFNLIVNGTAEFNGLNLNKKCTVKNYGTLTLKSNYIVDGKLENHGELFVQGNLNINSPVGQLSNNNLIIIEKDFNNINYTVNGGTFKVYGNFDNNGGSGFENLCTTIISYKLLNNTFILNKGSISVGTWSHFNGASKYQGDAGSVLSTQDIVIAGIVEGIGNSCASVTVVNETNLTGSSLLTGKIDICDANGVNYSNGRILAPASTNCSCQASSNPAVTSYYTWPENIEAEGAQASGLSAGSYTVSVNLPGCTPVNKSFTIGNSDPLQVNVETDGFIAEASVSGGTKPYFYFWSGSIGGDSIQEYQEEGIYTLQVTDSKGCSGTDNFTIGIDEPCEFTVVTTNPVCAESDNGTATVFRNGKILTTGSTISGGTSFSCSVPQSSPESCSSGCNPFNENNETLDLYPGEKICLTSTDFRGGINIYGGTLVICGTATPSYVNMNNNGQPFTLIVNGTFNWPNFNFDQNTTVRNYGTININGSCGFNGQLENHGKIYCQGDFDINSPAGQLINHNYFYTQYSFNNKNTTINGGTIETGLDFKVNGGSELINSCKIFVGNEYHNNTSTLNRGIIMVDKWSVMNGGSSYKGDAGSLLSTEHLMSNGALEGVGNSCAMVQVKDKTTINGTSILSGKLDLCDANGVDTQNGLVISPATTNCSCQGAVAWNPPLVGGENPYENLSPGSYTVNIDIAGCQAESFNFEITAPSAITASVLVKEMQAEVAAEGGVGNFEYHWSDGYIGSSSSHEFDTPGYKWVTISDGKTCSQTINFTIENTGYCTGECASFSVEYTTGNTFAILCACPGSCNITDSDGNTLVAGTFYSIPECTSKYVLQTPDNCYLDVTVKGKDVNCLFDPLEVTFNVSPRSYCEPNGKIKLTIENGSGQYEIYNSSNTQVNSTVITGLDKGITKVTIIDELTGIEKNIDIEVGNIDQGNFGIVPLSFNAEGMPVSVKADIVPASVYSEENYSVIWSTGQEGHGPITIPASAYNKGVISAVITDPTGCSTVRSLNIAALCPSGFEPQFEKTLPSCYSYKDGNIELVNLPENTKANWSWTPTLQTGKIARGLSKGDYKLTLVSTLANNEACIFYEGNVNLGQPEKLNVSITGGPEFTASVNGGSPDYTYVWSNGVESVSTELTEPGLYNVTATDENGCKAKAFKRIWELCPGTFDISPKNPTCPGAMDGQVSAVFSTPDLIYYWTGKNISNPGNSSITGLDAGTYVISVSDPISKCNAYAGVDLRNPDKMIISHLVLAENTVKITVENREIGSYTIVWTDNNFEGNKRNNLTEGVTYELLITDENNCPQPYKFVFNNTCGSNPISLSSVVDEWKATINVSAQIGAVTFDWGDGSVDDENEHVYASNGIYTVTVFDSRNCGDEINVSIGTEQCTSPDCQKIDVTYLLNNKFKITCDCPGACFVLDENGEETPEGSAFDLPLVDAIFQVKTPDGCIQDVIIKGKTGNQPEISYVATPVTCNSKGSVILTIQDGSGNYYISNSSNAQTNNLTITDLPAGITYVTVVDKEKGFKKEIPVTMVDLAATTANIEVLTRNGAGIPKMVQLNITPPVGYSTSPYNISWSTGHSGTGPITLSDDIVYTGIVTASIVDKYNCNYMAVLEVQPCNESFTPVYQKIQPTCFDRNDGQLILSNMPSNASIMWTGPTYYQNNPTAYNLKAGNYGIVLTKTMANGQRCNLYRGSVYLGQPEKITINISQSGDLYTASATGGTPGYTNYQWQGFPSGPSVTLTNPGNYIVSVADSKNCQATRGYTIPGKVCSKPISFVPVSPKCPEEKNGQITATYNASDVTYSWTGPDVSNPSNSNQQNIGQGAYLVSVNVPSENCATYAGIVLKDPLPMVVSHKVVGDKVYIHVSNGKGSPKVKWLVDNKIENPRSDLVVGQTYFVEVMDDNNCTMLYNFPYTNPCQENPVSLSIQISGKTATATVSGGSGAYTYIWSDGITDKNNTHEFTNDGNSFLRVEDENRCFDSKDFSIKTDFSCSGECEKINVNYTVDEKFSITCECPGDCQVTDPDGNLLNSTSPSVIPDCDTEYKVTTSEGCIIPVIVSGKDKTCTPGSLSFAYKALPTSNCRNDGSIQLKIKNGSGQYRISNSSNDQLNNVNITGLSAGTVTVFVYDEITGFSESKDIVVSAKPSATLEITAEEYDQYGNVKSVKATIEPAEGLSLSDYSVSWSTGQDGIGPVVLPQSVYAQGTISGIITDPDKCPLTKSLPVVPLCPDASFEPQYDKVLPLCADDKNGQLGLLNLPANTTANWTGKMKHSTGAIISGIGKGDYKLILTKNIGNGLTCTLFDGVESLGDPVALDLSYVQNGDIYTATGSGGTGVLVYSWSNTATGPVATLNSLGIYTVTVTDDNSCSKQIDVPVEKLCAGTLSLKPENPSCPGTANGTLLAEYTGAAASILWTGENTINDPSEFQINELAPGYYFATVTETASQCKASLGIMLSDPEPLNISHNYKGDNSVNIVISNGKPDFTVVWRHDHVEAISRNDLEPDRFYTVDITDGTPCTKEYKFYYEPCEAAPVDIIVLVDERSATPVIQSGIAPFEYVWTSIDGGDVQDGVAIQNNLVDGQYSLVVYDARKCKDQAIIDITDCGITAFPQKLSDPTCSGTCDGKAILNGLEGLPEGTKVYWNNSRNPELVDACVGVHTVRVVTEGKCAIEKPLIMEASGPECPETICLNPFTIDTPAADKLKTDCFGKLDKVDIHINGGRAPFKFVWTVPAFTVEDPQATETFESFSEDFDNPSIGHYVLQVTDADKCAGTLEFDITGPDQNFLADVQVDPAPCQGLKASVAISVKGGLAPFLVNWPDGNTSLNRNNVDPGYYDMIVSDSRGCETPVAVNVLAPVFGNADITVSKKKICEGEETTLNAALKPGYTYSWSGPGVSEHLGRSLRTSVTGNYTVTYIPVMTGCLNQTSDFEVLVNTNCNPISPICQPIVIDYDVDPNANCIEQLEIGAQAHANYRYQSYLEEQKIQFKRNYLRHVLTTAHETLEMKYADSEHQYTLYYYDQAGNLVQTVPPAGVNPLSKDEVEDAIKDLKDDTRKIFTEHTMATTYTYNSLNQLVAQDVPDHTQMDLWQTKAAVIDLTETGELGQKYSREVSAVGFGSGNNGVLLANDASSAAFFATTDGGKSWTKVANPGVSTLNDIQQGDGYAVAVGNSGTFLKSIDNGQTWFIYAAPTSSDLIRLGLSGNTITLLDRNGTIWSSTDAGQSWTLVNNQFASLKGSQSITDAQVAENYIWVSTINDQGHIWYYNKQLNTWQEHTVFKTGNINALNVPEGASSVLAAGPKGTLFEINTFGDISVKRTNLGQDINTLKDIQGKLFAIAGTDHKLYASDADKRIWTEASSQIGISDVLPIPGNSNRKIVTTAGGLVANEDLSQFNAVPGQSGFTKMLVAANGLFAAQSGDAQVISLGDQLFFKSSSSSFNNTHDWVQATVQGLPSGRSIKDLYVTAPSTSLMLLDNGDVYTATELIEENIVNTLVLNATHSFTNIHSFYPVSSGIYMLSGTGEFTYTEDGITLLPTLVPSLPEPISLLKDIAIKANNSFANGSVSFTTGTIYYLDANTWKEVSGNIRPSGLKTIVSSGTAVYAAGNNGELFKKAASGNSWTYEPHTVLNLEFSESAIEETTGDLYLASGGYIYTYTGQLNPNAQDLGEAITEIDFAGERGLAATASGNIIKKAIGAATWTKVYTGSDVLNAVYANSNGNDLAAGTNGKILALSAGQWQAVNEPTIQPLKSLAFGANNNAVGVGDNGTIVTSSTAGQNWVVRYSNTTENLNTVTAYGDQKSVAAGNNGTIRYSLNGGQVWSSASLPGSFATAKINAVYTGNGSLVLALAANKVFSFTLPSSGGASITLSENTTLSGIGKSVFIDQDRHGFIVGEHGLAYKISPAGSGLQFTKIDTDANIDDEKGSGIPLANLISVEFTDQKVGYITGENGIVLKTIDGGFHWKSENAGAGIQTPILALSDGENGTVIDSKGEVHVLKDRAQEISTRFWYDELGRLVLSQNSKQYRIASYNSAEQNAEVSKEGTVRAYSYTLYDPIGRIVEVGELLSLAEPDTFKFGSQVKYDYHQNIFVKDGIRREITRTYYDRAPFNNILKDFEQQNLRTRVATTTYQDIEGATYDRATHYSYDIHGNVKNLVQEIYANGTGVRKRLDYDYDLVSGKVNKVYYQKDHPDQFIHKYSYDGDNRITHVYTSRNGITWDEDANYQYYGHGPLAQMQLGQQQVETIDYAYTLQGWIKGTKGQHFSYGLGYHTNDYKAIGASEATGLLATPVEADRELYNGNIATMSTHTPALGKANAADAWQTQQFRYDQLNRIVQSAVPGGNGNRFKTQYSYDNNGNILSLRRYDGSGEKEFDILEYTYETKEDGYQANTNKLRWVDDHTEVTEDFNDIKAQGVDNYAYDDIGNLIADQKEHIEKIEWTVYGKVRKILFDEESDKKELIFTYDASGNRVSKLVKLRNNQETSTFYVRDASGNVMAIYEQSPEKALAITEHHVYGSSRLGVARIDDASTLSILNSGRVLGLKDFEITDHLGNVRVVLNDARNSIGLTSVTAAMDYYAGGMIARSLEGGYRYGFNGQEKDDEIKGSGNHLSFGDYGYDPRLGRRWNLDPVVKPQESGYATFRNNPLIYVDPDGRDGILIIFPDYKVDPELEVTVWGKSFKSPKLPLGHAGVLLIDNKTGTTKYYEFGRYPTQDGTKGRVRSSTTDRVLSLSNVVIDPETGKPTQESLNKVMGELSEKIGQGGRIQGAYVEGDFDKMDSYAQDKVKESNPQYSEYDKDRKPYDLYRNNCGTFGCDVLKQDPEAAKNAPWILNPTPDNVAEEYQDNFPKVDYDPKTKTTTSDIYE